MEVEEIKKALIRSRKQAAMLSPNEDLLGTGSSLLNLAISGRVEGGIPAGRYVFFVGDSSSGKTFLSLTCLAEAKLNKKFRDYRLIFDDAEDGALMDLRRFFGDKVADTIEPPSLEKGEPVHSTTIEDFYFNLDDAAKKSKEDNQPFIYILDSMDALSSKYEGKKFDERKTAKQKGKEAKGDYGDGKAKINSGWMRRARADLRDTGSILIVICQSRDNINASFFEPDQTRAGGRALRFYADVEIWTSKGSSIKRKVRDKDRQVGINARLRIEKNRISGKEWSVSVPLLWSSGIDDVGSMVDYLVMEGQWPKNKGGMIDGSKDFKGCSGYREKVIQFIEAGDLEDDVRDLVADVWAAVEKACVLKRKRRYE